MKIIYFLVVLFTIFTSSILSASNCFIVLNDVDNLDIIEKRKLIESYGGRIIHEFPSNEYICDMTTSQFKRFIETEKVSTTSNHIDVESKSFIKSSSTLSGTFYWNYIKVIKSQKIDTVDILPLEMNNGCVISENYDEEISGTKASRDIYSVSSKDMLNTEYLIGKTAVCIILPESNGSTENWTIDEENIAVAQIVIAYDKLSELAYKRNIDVTWVYEIHKSVPVTEEPIEHIRPNLNLSLFWEFGWMGHALSILMLRMKNGMQFLIMQIGLENSIKRIGV